MIQDNIEHSTFLTSRRAANVYIKPILVEDSLINTPSLLPENSKQQKKRAMNLIKNSSLSNQKNNSESQLQIQEIFLNQPMKSQFEIMTNIYRHIYLAYHTLVAIYYLTLLYQIDDFQIVYIRNVGIVLAGIHQMINWKSQKSLKIFVLNIIGRDSYAFFIYLLSFIFPNQIKFFYVFISLLYYPTIYKIIRISLLLILNKTDFKKQFIIAEIFVFLYVVHLNASYTDSVICQSGQFYLKTINASLKAMFLSYQSESILFQDQLLVTLNIIFALTYYFSILLRYQTYQQTNFTSQSFESFIKDDLIKVQRGQFQFFKTLWNAYELSEDQNHQFNQIINRQRQKIYFNQIQKYQMLSNLFSKNFLYHLASSAEIITLQQNQAIEKVGLSMVIKGLMRIKLSDHLQIRKQLNYGQMFGFVDLLTNEYQGFQLDCISEQSKVLFISAESFHQTIQNYIDDKEIFKLIKDDIMNLNNTHLIDEKCYFCGSYHCSKRCPNTFINQIPNPELLSNLRKDQTNYRIMHNREKQRRKTYLKEISDSLNDSVPDSSESYFQDPVSEIVNPIPESKPYTSMLQVFPCSSKCDPEQSPKNNSNYISSNLQVAESQSIKKETNILSFKSLEQDHVNFNVDSAHNYKYYYPKDNADFVIDTINTKLH